MEGDFGDGLVEGQPERVELAVLVAAAGQARGCQEGSGEGRYGEAGHDDADREGDEDLGDGEVGVGDVGVRLGIDDQDGAGGDVGQRDDAAGGQQPGCDGDRAGGGGFGVADAQVHDVRGGGASALISTGADIAVVSKELGHSSIAVTSDIYGHLFDKAAKNMAKRAARLVPRGTKAAKKPGKTKPGRKAAGGNPDSKAA